MSRLMIYGATGYTGRMVARAARAAGIEPVLAGRDGGRLRQLADELGTDYRSFALDAPSLVEDALGDIHVLLNCAGPYARTAAPLMRACLASGSHYLDIAAELDSYRLAEALDSRARAAAVMLLPGSGGSVAMLGCLAASVIERVQSPLRLALALQVSGPMSRGSAISASENLTPQCLRREDGKLVAQDPGGRRIFDFGAMTAACVPVTLPDLVTIWHASGIPDIATYVHVAGEAFPTGDLSQLPEGPSAEERERHRYRAAVEVTGSDGAVARAALETVNGYSFTPLAAAEAARRVLAGEMRPGFQTPAGLFGRGFAETIADTRITHLRS